MSASGQSNPKNAKKDQSRPVLKIGGDVKGNIIVGDDNEFRQTTKTEKLVPVSERSKPKKEYGWQFGAVVIIALVALGCISLVTAAGRNPFATWFFTPTPGLTTSPLYPTEAIISPTPEIQGAACTFTHNCPAGQDWVNNCIAGYNWSIYSSSDFPEVARDEVGCYSQPILNVFYTNDGGLSILAQPTALTSSKDYGLFTLLPQSGNVSFTLDLNKIDNGQVWVGVFEKTDVRSTGVLLVVPPGDVREQAFALKTMPSESRVEVSRIFQNSEGKYTLGFELELGSIIASVEGVSMTPIPFTPRSRWLFVGYRAKLDDPTNGTANIQALFTDLKIK